MERPECAAEKGVSLADQGKKSVFPPGEMFWKASKLGGLTGGVICTT